MNRFLKSVFWAGRHERRHTNSFAHGLRVTLRARRAIGGISLFLVLASSLTWAEPGNKHQRQPPPAPRDTAPVLRADQIHQLQREEAEKAGAIAHKQLPGIQTETATLATEPKSTSVRKATGLKTTTVADTKSRRPVEVQSDQVLVRFKQGRTKAQTTQALSRYQSTAIERKTAALEKLGYRRVRVPSGRTPSDFLADLSTDAAIERVEANVILRSHGEKPADPTFGPDWGLQAIRASEAWGITQGNPSVIVAVIDTGIAATHPDLVDALVPGYNFIADNTEIEDDFGHGTQVAGIIAAKPNDEAGTSGIAPRSRLMPLKVLDANGEGTAADVAEAIVHAADSGVRVIALALGTYAESGVLQAAIEYAAARNCLIIAAGGNNGTAEPVYPAAYPQTLAVAALDQFRKPCFFSNRAPYIDIAAPGKDILVAAKGGGHNELTGTSAAAAHVAGLAALLVAVDPSLTPDNFQAIIRGSAADLQSPGWDTETGFGLVDCVAALNHPSASPVDIGIVDVMVLPQRPRPGQTASVVLTLRNHGVQPVTPSTVVLFRDGDPTSTVNVPALAPKQIVELIVPWTPLAADAEQTVSLVAEIKPIAGETATDDNTRQLAIPVTTEPHHDLAILSARTIGSPLTPGATFTVEVSLANLGNTSAPDVILKSTGLQRTSTTTLSMAPGERRNITTQWTFPDDRPGPDDVLPVYSLIFTIEPEDPRNSSNNTLVLKLRHTRDHGQIAPFHATGSKYSDNEYVHQWIANEAYKYFISQIEGSELGTYLGTISGSFIVENSDLLEGTFAEDRSNRDPLYQGLTEPDLVNGPFLRHFCAGADGTELDDGLAGYDSAYEQGLRIWNNFAKPDYPGNKSRAYYRFGHVVHLLTDMTVPAHTHNDEHPFSEPYENAMASDGLFESWSYGCTRSSLSSVWTYPLSVDYSNLREIFYRTANYTEDYDSGDEYGDASRGSTAYNPGDYPTTWHRPSEVSKSGGMSSTELTITADDLMPYAIRRMADLYRYFYKEVDTSDPTVSMTYPTSTDVNNPTIRNSLSAFNLTASASDAQSGTLKKGFQYKWSYWTGSAWSSWYNVSPSPTTTSVSFTPSQGATLYCFYVIGENGGGSTGSSANKYLRIDLPPTLSYITISGATAVNESSGAQYTCTAYYSDGSSANVTGSATWSENSSYASISSSGYLTTTSVSSDQPCRITATFGGQSDTHDITVKNVAATLSYISISGETAVNESSGAQYTCTAYYSDGSSANVTGSATWSENSSYASISSSGYLTTTSVSSDQPCRITATYGGQSDTHDVTIKNVAATLSYVTISGSTEVNESGGSQYTCTAYYSDGSSVNVSSSASWSENSTYASINSSGYLTTASVSSDRSCQITATYGGQSDTHDVTIKNVAATLSYVTISGSTTVNESGGSQYTCTAYYSDGSSVNVSSSASWSENSSYASIDGGGYLTTTAVSSDQSCRITASFGGQTDTHDITIKDTSVPTPTLSVTPSDQPVVSAAGTTTFTVSNTGGGTMSYTTSESVPWLSITGGGSGGNSGTITVSYEANSSTTPRTGTITVTAAGASGSPKSVTVTQAGTEGTGALLAWGDNSAGQCNVPAEAQSGLTAIAAGIHTVVLKNGKVLAWGYNSHGQCIVPAEAQSGVTAIAAGNYHTVALQNGKVLAWGANWAGQCNVPTEAQSGVTAIAAGYQHTAALKSGKVLVWGSNDRGQCNVPAEAQSGVTAIVVFSDHTVALKSGKVLAWGANDQGQCNVPTEAQSGVTAIAAGYYHTVALKNGKVLAWGANWPGQCNVPTEAQSGVTAIAAGSDHTIALKNGKVLAWGLNDLGQCIVPAAAQSGVTAIAGGAYHTLAYVGSASGTDTVSIISLSGTMDFGSVAVGSSAGEVLTINNTGNSILTVSSINYPSGFSGNWSGGTIAANGGSRNVTVTFSPTAAQAYSGAITVNSDKTSGTNTRSCSGTGVGAPAQPNQYFSASQPMMGYASSDWSFMTAWNLGSGAFQVGPDWYNGNSTFTYTLTYQQWIALFLYDDGTAQTRELRWSYRQPHIQ